MSVLIRLANRSDAPLWIDLLRVTLGNDYPAKEVYDLEWVARELGAGNERQTWVAEEKGRLLASISFLEPIIATRNPVANLGRCLIRPDSLMNGAAQQLMDKLEVVVAEQKQLAIMRVPLSDKALQALCMQHDFVCAGFSAGQASPTDAGRHAVLRTRGTPHLAARWPISHSLAQVGELGSKVLGRMGLSLPLRIEDGATGYPLQSLVEITESNNEQFEAHARDSAAPPGAGGDFHRLSPRLRFAARENDRLQGAAGATRRGHDRRCAVDLRRARSLRAHRGCLRHG